MKLTKRIISVALAAMMAVSAFAVGAVSASAASLKKPTGLKAKNLTSSVQLSWKKVSGAKSYKVYRGGTLIKTTKYTNAKDFSVNAGKSYTYKVKAVNGKKTSAAASVKITRVHFTDFKTVTAHAGSVMVKWNSRKGADKYVLYRKAGNGAYKKLTTTANKYYNDKKVTSGTTYKYQIAGYNSNTKSYSERLITKKITYLDHPTDVVARESLDTKSIKLSWNAVKGATQYAVYQKIPNETSFSKIAVVKGTSYTDEISEVTVNPTARMYAVKAIKGNSYSSYSNERFVLYMPKRNGENIYWFDATRDLLHVNLQLQPGYIYADGKLLADYASLNGLYTVEITEGEDVIALQDSVIMAVAKGKAQLKITINDEGLKIAKALDNGLLNKFTKRTVYIDIDVI